MVVKFRQKLIIRYQNTFLALKINDETDNWDLPGGRVDLPENHQEALVREIKEELGDFELIHFKPVEVITKYHAEKDIYMILVFYISEINERFSPNLSEEHCEFAWMTKDQFLAVPSESNLHNFIEQFL